MSEKRFTTLEGVFTPTLLSILGVIMYLRLGWVVGTVGLQNALLIIIIANAITFFTCLSVASITTNMHVGTGGAYAMISKSLGLEVGGSIGIPLYLSQAISVAFYITGFAECWVSIFPGHHFISVAILTWAVLFFISFISARFAFRLQYAIIVIVGLSIMSFFLGKIQVVNPSFFHAGTKTLEFWKVFAIFFPAVTGILAGVSMSGELKNPERSIPIGILSAVIISFCIYVLMAFRFAYAASSTNLVENTSIILELGRWRALIIAGIMGATISSALSMFVTGPRTLLALAKHRIVPFSAYLKFINKKSEPTTAILFTALIALLTLALGNLNAVAGLLTMFFLITYGALNMSVYIEKMMGVISYRPMFNVWLIFPLLGAIGCFSSMFLINPVFSIIAIVCIILIYIILIQQRVRRGWPDVRKGLFIFIAEQALKVASKLPYHPKIWKPNLLIPIEEPKDWFKMKDFLKSIIYPSGRIDFFTIRRTKDKDTVDIAKEPVSNEEELQSAIEKDMETLSQIMKEEGLFVASHIVESRDRMSGAKAVLQVLKSSFLAPNILLIKFGLTEKQDDFIEALIKTVSARDMGVMLFYLHPEIGLNYQKTINLWIREGSPNKDLAVLIALNLQRNWDANIRLIQVADDEEAKKKLKVYFERFKKLTRMPKETETVVLVGDFAAMIKNTPAADLNIFGMSEEINLSFKRDIINSVNTSVLFLRDSTHESAIV